MYLSIKNLIEMIPTIIKGKILSKQTDQAIPNAHVKILYGQNDEEVVSNKNGEFIIRSWQAYPLILIIEHKEFETNWYKIQQPTDDNIIHLEQKLYHKQKNISIQK